VYVAGIIAFKGRIFLFLEALQAPDRSIDMSCMATAHFRGVCLCGVVSGLKDRSKKKDLSFDKEICRKHNC
jgi:hypothetical protein